MGTNVETRFGEMLFELRASKRMSLREFCRAVGVDSSNISKIERGKKKPPQNKEALQKYAEVLGILDDEKKWQEFYHSACVVNNIIPDDVNKEIIPAFFRTVAKKKPTAKELEKIIKFLNED